ncbi:hypothetical protein [Archangium sp.]|uniref:hypothetical protein n=1 Tax=Archangium sp. TaxID=1872627 RepID=UPI002D4F3485|nr:hypothetical protein [Archangium sp.]HYO52041.1 hypothetical protein [Archangium sp.]
MRGLNDGNAGVAFRSLATTMKKRQDATAPQSSIVNSFNEWDPLEEVIVGVLEGAAIPSWHITLAATMPESQQDLFRQRGGSLFPEELIRRGAQELEEFVHILEAEGVKVRRPQPINHARPFETPAWRSEGGVYNAMPRDLLLVVGNDIIEAPMSWRSRYFEIDSYRPLLKEYFMQGARWTSAPKPQLLDELYDFSYVESEDPDNPRFVINEFEPTFDAADFIRCGRDIFAQRSHVTNRFGIDWLQRHLGDDYRVHLLDIRDPAPMHVDATFMPLAPGKLLVNPERIRELPKMFSTWDVLEAPKPTIPASHPMFMSSTWVSMNVLMLDEERVVVERQEEPLIRALEDWEFKVIRCDFRHVMSFGGAFHCVTCDVRRRGPLRSYF